MLFKGLIAGVITLAIIGTAGQIIFPPKPVLLYNPSESAAVGWYRVRPNEWARILADERGYLPYDYPLF